MFFGNPAVANVLLAGGAPVTNLAEAAGTGQLDPRTLADADQTQRAAALRAAAVCEQLDTIDQLLAAGVQVDLDIDAGATALHFAAFHGKPAAVRHLVDRGADPTRQDNAHHARPLDHARYRHRELFRPSPGHDAVENYLAAL